MTSPVLDRSTPPRVLIADDDAVLRSVLTAQLGTNFEVVGVARDAKEASALAAELQPDLAILDVNMPEGGGLAAARSITTCSPDTAIVAYSADESRSGVIEMINAGAVTYLRKGIPADELASTLLRSVEAKYQLG